MIKESEELNKEENGLKFEKDGSFLKQLVNSLDKAQVKMKDAYKKKDYKEFKQMKKLMLEIQDNINKILKNDKKKKR